jgi:hypothetical protein
MVIKVLFVMAILLLCSHIRFDPENGAVYNLKYTGMSCRDLGITVLLLPDETRDLQTEDWVCQAGRT